MGGFDLGNWLVGAGKAIGKEIDHAATGLVDLGKTAIGAVSPVAMAHEFSGAAKGITHEAGGALVGVSQSLSMPMMIGGLGALVFLLTQQRR